MHPTSTVPEILRSKRVEGKYLGNFGGRNFKRLVRRMITQVKELRIF